MSTILRNPSRNLARLDCLTLRGCATGPVGGVVHSDACPCHYTQEVFSWPTPLAYYLWVGMQFERVLTAEEQAPEDTIWYIPPISHAMKLYHPLKNGSVFDVLRRSKLDLFEAANKYLGIYILSNRTIGDVWAVLRGRGIEIDEIEHENCLLTSNASVGRRPLSCPSAS